MKVALEKQETPKVKTPKSKLNKPKLEIPEPNLENYESPKADNLNVSDEIMLSDSPVAPTRKESFNTEDNIINNQALTSDIMDRANKILRNQFPEINGFQCTLLAPNLNFRTGEWDYALRLESRTPPTVQIHHNGSFHWIVTVQSKNNRVYMLDSKYCNELSTSLRLQFSSLYGSGKTCLNIFAPNVQQQHSSSLDCGVFAIANAVEFCFNGYPELEKKNRTWDFDTYVIRQHLLECLINEEFTIFPKIKVSPVAMNVDVFDIKIDCLCGLANITGSMMVSCDHCRKWFHQNCSNQKNLNISSWLCDNCKNKRLRRLPKKHLS